MPVKPRRTRSPKPFYLKFNKPKGRGYHRVEAKSLADAKSKFIKGTTVSPRNVSHANFISPNNTRNYVSPDEARNLKKIHDGARTYERGMKARRGRIREAMKAQISGISMLGMTDLIKEKESALIQDTMYRWTPMMGGENISRQEFNTFNAKYKKVLDRELRARKEDMRKHGGFKGREHIVDMIDLALTKERGRWYKVQGVSGASTVTLKEFASRELAEEYFKKHKESVYIQKMHGGVTAGSYQLGLPKGKIRRKGVTYSMAYSGPFTKAKAEEWVKSWEKQGVRAILVPYKTVGVHNDRWQFAISDQDIEKLGD